MSTVDNSTGSTTLALLTKGAKGTMTKKTQRAMEKVGHLDVLQQSTHLIESLDESTALKKAKDALDSADENLFVLGGILDAIYTNAWHTGYDGFKDLVEDMFGMKLRKAMYLMKIYNDIVENEIPWEKVSGLGWTKLRVLSSILNLDNVDEWAERAAGMTVLQIQEFIRAMKDSEGEETDTVALEQEASTVTTLTFKVHDDQKEIVQDAIGQAKDAADTEYDGVALEYICMDYMGSTNTSAGSSGAKVTMVSLMQESSAEEVLQVFDRVFPEVSITATL